MQQTSSQAYLIVQLGRHWNDILRLQEGQQVVIGRSSENEIVFKDDRVSRKHAQIMPHKSGWVVADLGSRNGTFVDGKPISEPWALKHGNIISVGGGKVTFSTQLQGSFPGTSGEEAMEPAAQLTSSGGSRPTIVNRISNSQWSSNSLAEDVPDLDSSSSRRATENWSFFYQLVFDLVHCESPDQAAQVALDRLVEGLGATAGGVIGFGSPPPTGSPHQGSPHRGQQGQERATTDAETHLDEPLDMVVLATKQNAGTAYHRVSDFLVRSVLQDRQAVLARNVMDDPNLSLQRESARHNVASIICAPIFTSPQERQELIGLLHVYTSSEQEMLQEADLHLVLGVADNLSIALARQAQQQELADSLESSRRKIDELQRQLEVTSELVGTSDAMQQVRSAIDRTAPTGATVLIRGESGVGKELVARGIHFNSRRREGPLVCMNCAALAPTLLESELFGHEKGAFTGATDRKVGKFEAADGGTLLLDEIGEMTLELQAKFLRVLEGQPFERLGGNKSIQTDVRVVAATNRDLEEAVKQKQFRADLYFRLRVIEIVVPPLRERRGDLSELVDHFLNQLTAHAGRRVVGIDPAALEILSKHDWPGNVRELRNVIERAVVLGSGAVVTPSDINISGLQIDPAQLTEKHPTAPDFRPISIAELEREHIFAMLEHTGGNKSKASQLLGIERSTLDRKLKRFDA